MSFINLNGDEIIHIRMKYTYGSIPDALYTTRVTHSSLWSLRLHVLRHRVDLKDTSRGTFITVAFAELVSSILLYSEGAFSL